MREEGLGWERHVRMTGMTLTIFGENYLASFSERGKQNEAQKSNFWKFGSVYRFCFPVCRTLMLHFVAELWKISEMDSPSPGLCYNFPCFSWIWVFNLMPKYTLYCLLTLTSLCRTWSKLTRSSQFWTVRQSLAWFVAWTKWVNFVSGLKLRFEM